ncbi:hypothetical protein CPter91_4195 [Collimonas pratensis]|uniref:Uncharacterized protein n=1 Tax=Collimonas pratensis TaxID=279113 RepID=A0A127Q8V8_9BURK|nr:hypothetical protein CPter91_4195 [Collimonas pratensis]
MNGATTDNDVILQCHFTHEVHPTWSAGLGNGPDTFASQAGCLASDERNLVVSIAD